MTWRRKLMLALHRFPLILAFASCGSTCDPPVDLDNGFQVTEDGLELHPGRLPAAIAVDDTVTDLTLLPQAIGQWNTWLSRDGIQREVFAEALDGEEPRVTVAIGYVPAPDSDLSGEGDPLGVAHLDYTEDGEIVYAEVTLSSDYAYDRPTMLQALLHEVGHDLALADDPGPPVTVDLRSVMSSPLDPLGELTSHDFSLLLQYVEGM